MVQVVWYKRDLRIEDHEPLWQAAEREGGVLPLYIVEPSQLQADTFDPAHWSFISRSLAELRERLAELGQPLVVRIGEALPVLQSLHKQRPLSAIWAHEETTDLRGFARDRAVRDWTRAAGIPFHELPHSGVFRRLQDRNEWENLRAERLSRPALPPPAALRPVDLTPGRIPTHEQLRLARDRRRGQPGGSTAARALLDSFLTSRGSEYVTALSSPLTAADACSRLSPHLAYGTLSVRTAAQAAAGRLREIRQLDPEAREALGGRWRASLRAFESRLAWRDHFIQKIESQPDIETENLVRAFDGLRPNGASGPPRERLEAWQAGRTGIPMVDACMRFLGENGWINFRMRAMLVSFAAHDLWLHWRGLHAHLARAFVDYEPGIHYCQLQMQSGTAGNQTLRIYDPARQGREQDPNGEFVRRWLPELEGVPTSFIHAPHLMPAAMQQQVGCVVGRDYPAPLIDHATAAARARERLAAVRHDPIAQEQMLEVRLKHSGRLRDRSPSRRPKREDPDAPQQLRLF